MAVNFKEDKKTLESKLNNDLDLVRFEWIEILVRIAIAKYVKEGIDGNTANALGTMITTSMTPKLKTLDIARDHFRAKKLYVERVDMLLKQSEDMLTYANVLYVKYAPLNLNFFLLPCCRDLFVKYGGQDADIQKKGGTKQIKMSIEDWMGMMHDLKLLSSDFPDRNGRLAFVLSRMRTSNEFEKRTSYINFFFCDFLEAICRVADAMTFPTNEEMQGTKIVSHSTLGTTGLLPCPCPTALGAKTVFEYYEKMELQAEDVADVPDNEVGSQDFPCCMGMPFDFHFHAGRVAWYHGFAWPCSAQRCVYNGKNFDACKHCGVYPPNDEHDPPHHHHTCRLPCYCELTITTPNSIGLDEGTNQQTP